jgi:4-amino-4-deoxy-L-arabinose transferase-like glycosyltransferase
VLVAGSWGYGYHRDELYFIEAAKHPAFGYPDQPPLTPLLGWISTTVFGQTPAGLRIFPELATALSVVVVAMMARELGGGWRAQAIAAGGAAGSLMLYTGHLLSTTTFDLLAWLVILWLLIRLIRTGEPRLWLVIGVVAGIALENKDLLPLLAVSVAAGAVLDRRPGILLSPWLLAGIGIAAVIALPNLIWQADHGWPQLEMAGRIQENKGADDRASLLPSQLFLLSPLLAPIWIAGLVWLIRSREARPWRLLAWAYAVILVITFITGGQPYYPAALVIVFLAGGAVVTERWLRGSRRRSVLVAAGVVLAVITTAPVALPIIPVDSVESSPVAALNDDVLETIGWPRFTRTVAGVYRSLPPDRRSGAVIFTSSYGEAGAIDRYGPDLGLPRAYSGHNGYGYWGIPPDRASPIVAVGLPSGYLSRFFEGCRLATRIDDGVDVDNEEQGAPVTVCRAVRSPWAKLWPRLSHLD